MEPERSGHGTLVDLLDRVLDKGLVLNANVIVSLAGVPLIGLNVALAIAAIDTMLDYGVWDGWDEARAIRDEALEEKLLVKEKYHSAGSVRRL